MISVSNVTPGQAASYYDKDGYYARTGDTDSQWVGDLKDVLDLPDRIKSKDFKQLLYEHDKYAGMDICFSPPKSVSIAALCMDEKTGQRIKRAFDDAVNTTLSEIEKEAIIARVTTNHKTEYIKTGNMICGQFTHYVSRDNDPQLHKHCVVLNKTLYNGKYYAVDNRTFYKNRGHYIQLFENTLATNLLVSGIELRDHPTKEGRFELNDICDEAIKQMSKRRAEIEKKVKDWGTSTDVAGERAALQTRKAKEHRDLNLLIESWKETMHDIRQGPITINTVPIIPKEQQIQEIYEKALSRMSRKTYAFTEKSFKKMFLTYGVSLGVTEEQFDALFKEGIRKEIHFLGERKEGKTHEIYYCTEKSYQMESEIFEGIKKGKNTMLGISKRNAETYLNQLAIDEEGRRVLNDEQWNAVIAITTTRDRHFAIQGFAGTGKTHTLNYARQVFEAEGYEVKGACFTGKATRGLEKDAKIPSKTLHSFLNSLEREAGNDELQTDIKNKVIWNLDGLKPGARKEVWIVDEASMVDNVAFWHLMKAAELKRAKVVYVGDEKQHSPVGVGNAFANLVKNNKINHVTLKEIVRQKNVILRDSVIEAAKGDIAKSFNKLSNQIEVIPNQKDRLEAIVNDYLNLPWEQRDRTVILTAANVDRKKINQQIRKKLIKSGELKDGLKCEVIDENGNTLKRTFAAGDKIVFLRNDNKVGVMNGQTGFIGDIKDHIITVVSDKDPNKERIINYIDLEEYGHIDHGYALTSYKAQSITEDQVLIHIDSSQSFLNTRNAFYVDISRARYNVRLYVDDLKRVKRQVREFAKKLTTDDFVPATMSLTEVKPERQGDDHQYGFDITKFKQAYDNMYTELRSKTQVISINVTSLRKPEIGIAQKLGYEGSSRELMNHSICYMQDIDSHTGRKNNHFLSVDSKGRCYLWDDKSFKPVITERSKQIKTGIDIYRFVAGFDHERLFTEVQLKNMKEYLDSCLSNSDQTMTLIGTSPKRPNMEV